MGGHLRQVDDQGSGTLCVGVTTYCTRWIEQLSFLIWTQGQMQLCVMSLAWGPLPPASCSLEAGPTWDRGPHVEAALPRLQLILVVE